MSAQEITKELTFITPALLAGADQNTPEIRAPSIRGALRWWFRVLSTEDAKTVWELESRLFGSVHHKPVLASPIVIRVAEMSSVLPTEKVTNGVAIKSETSFTLQIVARRAVEDDLWERLTRAVVAFSRLGALGRRATRRSGLVAAQKGECPTEREFREWAHGLRRFGLSVFLGTPQANASVTLKGLRKSALRKNAAEAWKIFGRIPSSGRGGGPAQTRQASPLRLGRARFSDRDEDLPLLFYTDKTAPTTQLWDFVRRELLDNKDFEEL